MDLGAHLEFIEPGVIRIKGHRIYIEHIVERLQDGMTPAEIVKDLPSLSLNEVNAAITYYSQHQAEVDGSIKRIDDWAEQQYQASLANPSPPTRRLQAILAHRRQQSA